MYLFRRGLPSDMCARHAAARRLTQPTIFDHLDQAGVSWRYYYQDNGAYLPQWSTYQRDAAKLAPIANWAADLQNEAGLPSVIFIERAGPSGLDEHPGNNTNWERRTSPTF